DGPGRPPPPPPPARRRRPPRPARRSAACLLVENRLQILNRTGALSLVELLDHTSLHPREQRARHVVRHVDRYLHTVALRFRTVRERTLDAGGGLVAELLPAFVAHRLRAPRELDARHHERPIPGRPGLLRIA